jgi:serine/threonine protein kinase
MGCSSSSLSITSLKDFHVAEKIGIGGFAEIYRVIHKPTKSCYAMKVIDIKACCDRKGGLEMLRSELLSLASLAPHPFVAKLHFGFQNYFSCYLIFDLFEGGDLRSYLNTEYPFTEKMVAFFAGCIGSALHHIHSCGVLHRDVKPENIIFDLKGFPKLIDFGIAYVCSDETMICTNCSGTRLYSAPELFTPSSSGLHEVRYEVFSLLHDQHSQSGRDHVD